jgi:hypothetical protein
MLQAVGIIGFWYVFSEGLRKVFVNRFEQERQREKLKNERAKLYADSGAS